MVSVLAGFFTIFIGVFMVNDAKASHSSLLDKSARNSAVDPRRFLQTKTADITAEHHLLKTFNQHGGYEEEEISLA